MRTRWLGIFLMLGMHIAHAADFIPLNLPIPAFANKLPSSSIFGTF